MLTRIVMTVIIMVMCLFAMSITAYAYFSHNVTSGISTIKAASFEANVSITITDSKSNPVATAKNGKMQTANLEAGKYEIKLTGGNSTAQKGFCVITIGDKKYYTDQIGVDAKKNSDHADVTFNLWLSAPTKIEVLSHWGTSVYYGYQDSGRNEIFIVSGATLDLTTAMQSGQGDKPEGATVQSGETTTPTTDATTETGSTLTQTQESTTPATTPSKTTGTSEPATTTEPGSTTESSVSTNATEPAKTEPEETTTSTETQPATENTETTGAFTTEAVSNEG